MILRETNLILSETFVIPKRDKFDTKWDKFDASRDIFDTKWEKIKLTVSLI